MKKIASTDPEKKRTLRVEAHVSDEQKRVLKQGATLAGLTLDEFVFASAFEAARNMIKYHQTLEAKRADQLAALSGILGESHADDRSQNAAASYHAIMGI